LILPIIIAGRIILKGALKKYVVWEVVCIKVTSDKEKWWALTKVVMNDWAVQ
jgi:hypothetical protein